MTHGGEESDRARARAQSARTSRVRRERRRRGRGGGGVGGKTRGEECVRNGEAARLRNGFDNGAGCRDDA